MSGNLVQNFVAKLLAYDLHEHPLAAAAIEFTVKYLLPRSEVEFGFGYGNDDLAAHDLAFEVSVGVIFSGPVVFVLRGWFMRRQLFQPDIVVKEQSIFGVVDVDAGSNMHGVDEAKAFFDAAFAQQVFDGVSDVQVTATMRDLEPKMLRK